MKPLTLLTSLASTSLLVAAHKEPKTHEEIEVQRALQAAAYHCSPAVAEFTAARKRSWAQKVLTGNPALPGYTALFAENTYADYAPGGIRDRAAVEGTEKLLSCNPVEATKIENNTCVLAPEVTEGPYYHLQGHLIRQNIAEYQDGLLTLLDIGVIDVETCSPMPNVLVDIWHANGTGHYAGHPWPKPHLKDEKPQVGGKRSGLLSAFPRTEPHETWLRGAWPTDQNGVAQFTSTSSPSTHRTDWSPVYGFLFSLYHRLMSLSSCSHLPGILHWSCNTHPHESIP
ncbi:hypothetical protein HGRIS_014101 [Hohenbuehelia grisea]|uniref:Intradiol ring-cleavage dioxygenases domain-containing protein n=1 Tax=Hohenbuehelia grisea TaxID=104357 RepID=A0ABR3JUC0_9AGAR